MRLLMVNTSRASATELAKKYQVAPTTIAEVIRVLDAKGLITTKTGPHGGVFVAPRSIAATIGNGLLNIRGLDATAIDCVRVIDALEPAIAVAAAAHRTDRDIRDLRQLLVELEQSCTDRVSGLRANWNLHRRIAEIVPNPALRTVYLNLLVFIEAEAGDTGLPRNSEARLRVHHELVEAIASGDRAATVEAVRNHETVYDDGLVVTDKPGGSEPAKSL